MDSILTLTLGPSFEQVQIWNAADTVPQVDFVATESIELTFDGTTVTYDDATRTVTLKNILSIEMSCNEHAMVFIVTPMHSVTVAGKTARLFGDGTCDTENVYDITDAMRTNACDAGRIDLSTPGFSEAIRVLNGNDDSHLSAVPSHMQREHRRYERLLDDPMGLGPNH